MKNLFKENFTMEELGDVYGNWDNEGVLYGWQNGDASEVQELLENHGYNLDSIKVMNKAFETLELILWEYYKE